MGDIYVNNRYQRWNKCLIHRDLNLSKWTYCILTFCAYLQCALSVQCNSYNSIVGTYPQGDIKVLYPGHPLEILCMAEENITSSSLEFTINAKPLTEHTTVINDTTIRLYIEQPEKQSNIYYCTYTNAHNSKKHCINNVLVDEPPPKITDFKCRSKNMESLRCTWPYPKTFTSISYHVSFYLSKRAVPEVTANRTNNSVSCEWTLSTKPQYRTQEEEYNISLVGHNVFGVTKQSFIINHYAIVIPDKPRDLMAVSTGPDSALLNWTISRTIQTFLKTGIEYKIEYQIAKSKEFHRVNTSTIIKMPKNGYYFFNLTNLPYAYMGYEVRVYVKSAIAPDDDEFWSYSYQFFETKSEKPNRPPETAVGAFMKTLINSRREIFIYWKQLEEYERNGPNFTYKAIVKQDNRVQLYTPVKDKSMSYIDIKDASMSAVEVNLRSYNNEGSSENSSYLYVPSEDNILEGPASFTKLAYENGTYALYWELKNIDHIDNYTLFWCQYNVSRSCVGRMDFTYLDPNKTSHVIDNLSKEINYQFAISVNNGIKSSGMYWAKCDISHDIIVMYAFPVTLSHDATGKNYVTLSWTMACSLQNNIIVAYNISYCPVVDKFFCNNQVQNKSMLISPEISQVNITDLLPYTTYRFSFALNTTYGLREVENATDHVTTLQDSPQKPVNVSVTEITYDSLIISWDPPVVRNGIIQSYVIYNHNTPIHKKKIVDFTNKENEERQHVQLQNLNAFTNYSLRVQACNSEILCSKLDDSDALFLRTCIGPPSELKRPERNDTDSMELLVWEAPIQSAGTVDMYQVKRVKDDSPAEIFNVTKLWHHFKFCEGVSKHESYEVRAVNFDHDLYHGAFTDNPAVVLPLRSGNDSAVYYGPWSQNFDLYCQDRKIFTMTLMFILLLFVGIGMVYGSLKLYRRYKRMEDIKPELPKGLVISEKEINKYGFSNWNPSNKDSNKDASSDEVRLLPTKPSVPSSDTKQSSICTPAHTDSTAVSEVSKEPIERLPSTSDEGSNSSLGSDTAVHRNGPDNDAEDADSSSDIDGDDEGSPYTGPTVFDKLPNNGYVQHTIPDTKSEYVMSAPIVSHSSQVAPSLPTTSSYVMAGLPPHPIFSTRGSADAAPVPPRLASGYVCPEAVRSPSLMNFPSLGPSPTKATDPEGLPPVPPAAVKTPSDSIQLQPLRGSKAVIDLGALGPKPNTGYVSPGDALLQKHLSIVSGAAGSGTRPGQDPGPLPEVAMSPDAYCRFSWSKDPTTDNLHSWLAEATPFENPDLTETHS